MKKAYVKPVFLAEEFEGTVSVAACGYSSRNALHVWEGKNLCLVGSCAHAVNRNGNALVTQWWEYATEGMVDPDAEFTNPTSENFDAYNDVAYLFTDSQTVCDFVWNGIGSEVGIWTSEKGDVSTSMADHTKRDGLFVTMIDTFSKFFDIEPSQSKQHVPGVNGEKLFS